MNRRSARPNLLAILGLALGIFFSAAQPGTASLITFVAEGTVNSVDPVLAGPFFSVGDAFTVTFTFDSLTPDSNPDPNRGFYGNAITSLLVTVGTYSATASGNNAISVDNDLGFGVGDQYAIDLTDPMSGPSVNGWDVSSQTALLLLGDPTATALSSDALLTDPPNLADFGGFVALEFIDPTIPPDPDEIPPLAFVGADLTSFSLIPEPATLLLLALCGLALSRRHRPSMRDI